MLELANFIADNGIKNVLWLTGDVHYNQVIKYKLTTTLYFYEFTAGPLSAGKFNPSDSDNSPLDDTLNPTIIYRDNPFFNFGLISIEGETGHLELEFMNSEGDTYPMDFPLSLDPQP